MSTSVGAFANGSGYGFSLESNDFWLKAADDYEYPKCFDDRYAGPFGTEEEASKARDNLNARANHLATMASRGQSPTPIQEFMAKHPK